MIDEFQKYYYHRYYERHKQKERSRKLQYYYANRERILARMREQRKIK